MYMPDGAGYYPLAVGHFHFLGDIMDISEWRKKNSAIKSYAHFDKRVSVGNNFMWNYITNPQSVAHHGFYPFIRSTRIFKKYNKTDGVKNKERPICYSAHIDRCIYQYYSFLLNERYNQRALDDGINNVAIAYRNNLEKQNNITFAKTAFDFIKASQDCFIMIGDFTSFFDKVDHNYLKSQLCSLLGVTKLSDDYYAVFKNITRYSFWDISDLLKINGLPNTQKGIRELNEKGTVLSSQEFKQHKKQYIQRNGNCGIPQGSAISAVLANIYMLSADKIINNYVRELGGLYMRYSDDFIITLPNISVSKFNEVYSWIMQYYKDMPGVELSPEKTKLYHFCDETVFSYESAEEEHIHKSRISFLGFSFDGTEVTIRDKTVSKYYYRLYKKAKYIVKSNFVSPNENPISCRNLYRLYSSKGAKSNSGMKGGNFITYVNRAYNTFDRAESVKRPVRKHMRKIRKALKTTKNRKTTPSV